MWPFFFYAKAIGTWLEWTKKKGGCPYSLVSYGWGFQTQPSCYLTKTLKFAYKIYL